MLIITEVLPLAELKKNLEFNQEITEIVDILKNIAISCFHRLKQKEKFKEFGVSLENFLQAIDFGDVEHRFLKATQTPSHPDAQPPSRETGKLGNWETGGSLVVAITSNEPFVGGLNIKVINAALHQVTQTPRHPDTQTPRHPDGKLGNWWLAVL